MSFLSPVDNILSQYHKDCGGIDNVPIKVDLLKPLLEKMGYVDKFFWERLHCETHNVVAQVTTFKAEEGIYQGKYDYARIQFSSNLNYCWQRFVICKEMFQCVADIAPENRITTSDSLLTLSERFSSQFLDRIADEADAEDEFAPYESEQDAEIFALETLFPIELRRQHFDDYDNGIISPLQLALRYRIPEKYIRQGMEISGYNSAVLRGRQLVDLN